MFDVLDKNKNGKFEVSEAAEIVKLCAKIAAEASLCFCACVRVGFVFFVTDLSLGGMNRWLTSWSQLAPSSPGVRAPR